MRVRVLLFGVLRELVGVSEQELELPDAASAGAVLERLRARVDGRGGGLWDALAVAVNEVYAGRGQVLCEGDVVALLPPVSGG